MQFSIAKLFLLVTCDAAAFAVVRSIDFLGPLCLPVGLLLCFAALVAYPFAILTSPQKGTRLDPGSNPAIRYIHRLAGIGFWFIILFFAYVASAQFRHLYH